MRKLKIITLILTLIFTFQVPAYAGTFNFTLSTGYTPATLKDDASIVADANNFIQTYYNITESYFEEKVRVDANGNTSKPALRCQKGYNISDVNEGVGGITAPMLYYEKTGAGPEILQQYLGQTKDGYTITNVRYPFTAAWSFIENLAWVPAGDPDAWLWWKDKGNSLPTDFVFNQKTNIDPDYAYMLDFCMGAATLEQLRNWNGKQYYISKARATTDGKPGTLGSQNTFKPEIATNFPWHQYVNILQPPTYNTWGYGIGFFKLDGTYHYKSFPISPLRAALVPDFFPTPEGSSQWKADFIDPAVCAKTYSYKLDQTSITFPVTLKNVGEKEGTDFKAVWYGSSAVDPDTWSHPFWQADTQTVLNKGEFKTFNVTVNLPVPDYANGILVFKCNVDGKTPASELNQTNSSMFIKIAPEGVDIVADLPDEPTVYLINPGETAKVYVSLLAIRNDSGTTPVNVDVNYSGSFGSVYKQTSLVGYGIGENITGYDIRFNLSKPGTYTINASAWPIGMTDTNPSNNTDQTTVIVKLKDQTPAHKVNPDDQTRVNLRS